ncbi:amidohydrolase family protein [Roseomonas sp. AR75]|uniref:amidohydrolase family protein n=1 Tax=Roseomonas sp. AR75 TaxID=2562311 RepID=UPI0010BFDAC5|nr:amidohydrolase family protein [Roseomonas sp. AR75]
MSRLLFRGATLLPGGEDWQPRRADILLEKGHVARLDAAEAPADAEVIDASRLLLLPAFDNAHTHSPEALARGRAPMERLDGWLGVQYAAGEDTLPEAEIRRAILLCAAEAIRGGAVRVTDHFRQSPQTRDTVAVAAAAWGESGMRARLAVMLRDLPSPSGTPTMDAAACLALAEAVLRDPPRGATLGIGPSAPQRCSDALLGGLAALAHRHGSFVHLHVCETAMDRVRCLERYGRPAVMQLEALNMAGPDVEYAHCVHLDDDELDRMAESGTTLVHNPLANLRLGSGIAPVARALARGVRVAIGTDGAGSNDTQDMLEAAKLALLLPRAGRPDAEWPTPEQVLRMATRGAVLAPGAVADLIAFDLSAPAFVRAAPEELAARLLLAARPRDLRHVVGAGAFLLRDGTLTSPALRAVAP